MDNETFWGRVKPLIKAHKMTHAKFAQYLGVSPHTFSGWIKHERVPDTSTAYDMAVTLGVPLNYLLGGREAEIADWRLKELTMRDAAAKIMKLAGQVEDEARKIRPIIKM